VKRGKKYQAVLEKIDITAVYLLEEAVGLLKEHSRAGFDETVEIAVNLNILQKHTVRDSVVLPHGTGKTVRVLVFARGDKAKEAREAGADVVGDDDLIEKIRGGWFDFDVAVATPDMMKDVGKIGKVLGPRGLMPNPKGGTVTTEVGTAVQELKRGKTEFRADKTNIVHLAVGKISMEAGELAENCAALYRAVLAKRPPDLKGEYIRSVYLSTTMGPGLKIDHRQLA
jgi:large subunit ribosomal protein L1